MRSSHTSSRGLKKPPASELKKTAKLLRTLMTSAGATLNLREQILQIIRDHLQWSEVINTRSKKMLKNSYDPPLILAVRNGMVEVFELLLSSPVIDINLTGRNERNVLQYTAGYGANRGNFSMAKALLARPDLNLNAYDKFNTNALLVAAELQPTIADAMLDADNVELNRIGYRKIGGRKSRVYHSVLSKLIEYEMHYINTYKYGESKILLQAYLETIDAIIAKLLLKPGLQIDMQHKRLFVGGRGKNPFVENFTALMYAAHIGLHRVVSLLLEAGARLDVGDNSGRSALVIATDARQQQTVEVINTFKNRGPIGLFRPVAMSAPAPSAPPAEVSQPPLSPSLKPKLAAVLPSAPRPPALPSAPRPAALPSAPRLAALPSAPRPAALPQMVPAHYLFKPTYNETHQAATAPPRFLFSSMPTNR